MAEPCTVSPVVAPSSETRPPGDESNFKWMTRAFEHAQSAFRNREVPIGCLLVKGDEEIIGKGRNDVNRTKNATRHAEMLAIDEAVQLCFERGWNEEDIFPECTMYVTVEPCIMCASVLRLVGVSKVVFGCPNYRFGGCGSVLNANDVPLEDHPVPMKAVSGVKSEEAIELLKDFYKGENPFAPNPKDKTGRK